MLEKKSDQTARTVEGKWGEAITSRSFSYALEIIKFARRCDSDYAGRVIGRQLIRSGTSVGANVHEAQGGQSKADFVAKMSIAHKEVLETGYWLRLAAEGGIVPEKDATRIIDETDQLRKIIASILLTAKAGRRKDRATIEHSPVQALGVKGSCRKVGNTP